MSEFKVGDVVRLRSGSPALTVVEVREAKCVRVSWMTDGAVDGYVYPSAALVRDEEKR